MALALSLRRRAKLNLVENERMSEHQAESSGILAALQRLGTHGVELLQVRLSLLGTELEAEKLRLAQALMGVGAALLLLGLALVMLSAGALLLCPEPWRWLLALLLGLAYGLGGWLLWQRVQAGLSAPGGMFATSLAELQRDRDSLEEQ